MFTQTDFVLGCFLSASAMLYVWFPMATPAEQMAALHPAAVKARDLIDLLHNLIKEFKIEAESTNISEFADSLMQLSQLNMSDMRFRPIWPKSMALKNELDSLFDSWNETGDKLKKRVESLPKLTVNTVDRWRNIKEDLLKFEIKSADYDQLYGIVTRSNQLIFMPKAIALQDALQARAAQTLPVFPQQFSSELIEAQIRNWCEQIKDMNIDEVLKRISVEAAETQLKQLQRRRILEAEE